MQTSNFIKYSQDNILWYKNEVDNNAPAVTKIRKLHVMCIYVWNTHAYGSEIAWLWLGERKCRGMEVNMIYAPMLCSICQSTLKWFHYHTCFIAILASLPYKLYNHANLIVIQAPLWNKFITNQASLLYNFFLLYKFHCHTELIANQTTRRLFFKHKIVFY